jgi:hypothetical protein
MPKKQQKGKSLSSFYFRFLQPGDAIIGFLESAVDATDSFFSQSTFVSRRACALLGV